MTSITDKKFAVVSGKYAENVLSDTENVIFYPEVVRGEDNSPLGVIRRVYSYIKDDTPHVFVTNSAYVVNTFELCAAEDTDFFLAHKEEKLERVKPAYIYDTHCEAVSKLRTIELTEWDIEEIIS